MAETCFMRGAGGEIYEMDVPAEGTLAWERAVEAIAAGRLTPIDADRVRKDEWSNEVKDLKGNVIQVESGYRFREIGDGDAPKAKRGAKSEGDAEA